ncbi:MAG: serine/threonine protein kinase [Endozoicomonadaceae bacterium]|nr:serine/threonine protein kinase [Endozoicomonadaceae bacterium]
MVVLKEINLIFNLEVLHNKEVVNLLPEKNSPHFIRFFGEFINDAIVTDLNKIFKVKRYLAYEYIESGYSLSKIAHRVFDLFLTEKHINYIFYQLLEIFNALYKAQIEFSHLLPRNFMYCPTDSIIKVALFENASFEAEKDSQINYPDRQVHHFFQCI